MKGEGMKKRNKVVILILLLMISIIATACSAQKKDSAPLEQNSSSGSPSYYDRDSGETTKESGTNGSALASPSNVNSNDKIIYRVTMGVETLDFDNFIVTINNQINLLGGYVESSSIRGNSFYKENLRYGNIVARIPKDRLDEFMNVVGDTANVVSQDRTSENITLRYIDIESHKKALEIEQERLLALLEREDSLEDIIALESRLSSIRYELQSYESQLRTYDNLVEYSTVTLNIQEVKRINPVEEGDAAFIDRIQNGLSDTMYNLGEGIKNFTIWFIVNLPYMVIWGGIIIVVILVSRKIYRKVKITNINSNQSIKAISTSNKDISKDVDIDRDQKDDV